MHSPIIKVRNLSKSFPQGDSEIEVLHDINLDIQAQDFVAIVGQSGSGKSTLMNILGCLDQSTHGLYQVYGKEVDHLNSNDLAKLRSQHFGFIFQRYQLISGLTAAENVEIPAIYYGMSAKERQNRAVKLLSALGLEERLDYFPNQLSGGQQQRVSIARALMNGGEVIFADEPTGALDSKSGHEVMRILHNLNDQGHTIVMVTHDPKLAQEAKRIVKMQDGRIISDTRLSPMSSSVAVLKSSEQSSQRFFYWSGFINSLKENYKMAIRSTIHNKIRAMLTMLGIIFGIASVVSMVSIGQATVTKVLNIVGENVARTMFISSGRTVSNSNIDLPFKPLNDTDLNYLKSLPYLKNITPNLTGTGTFSYRNHFFNGGFVWSCDNNCLEAKDLTLKKGKSFNTQDIATAAQVALIDDTAQEKLFLNEETPLGKVITILGIPFKVVGVVETKNRQGGQPSLGQAYVPYTTAAINSSNDKLGEYHSIAVTVAKGYSIADVKDKIERYFTNKHGQKDFEIMSNDDLLKKFRSAASNLQLFILIVASISLLVGGIGVMNIMLVSVTERMQEIGIRMAVGAKQQDIKQQFLIESIILCLIGGALGITLAFLVGLPIEYISSHNKSLLLSFELSFTSLIVAVFFSTLIGIVFGYVPARNASRLTPVQALARE